MADKTPPERETVERLVAENVPEAVWLRLRRLTSSVLCSRIVARRGSTESESKGREIAWAVRSALGYWQSGALALNAKVLTRYYALLQISIAEELSLSSLEREFVVDTAAYRVRWPRSDDDCRS